MAVPRNFEMVKNADGTWTVKDVPIFAKCRRFGVDFDDEWLNRALVSALASQGGGHAFPVHKHHSKSQGETGPEKEPVGMFFVTRRAPIAVRGRSVPGVIADIVVTNPSAAEEIRQNRLPWRSVELPPDGSARFLSLALLDREPPFHEMAMTTVRDAAADSNAAPVAFATNSRAEITYPLDRGGPVLAFRASSESLHALIDPEATTMPETKDPVAPTPLTFQASSAADAVATLAEGLKSKKLEMGDKAKAKAALQDLLAQLGDDDLPVNKGGPAEVTVTPDAAHPEIVKMRAELEALKMSVGARDEREKLDAAVDAAVEKVSAFAVGKDVRARFLAFAEKGGVQTLDLLVDEIKRTVPPKDPLRFDDVLGAGASSTPAVPECVLKFQERGPEAYEKAVKHMKSWNELRASGSTTLSLEKFLEARSAAGFVRNGQSVEV